jgi:hypothetical protein
MEADLQALLDRDAIRDLVLKYCHYVNKNDAEGISGLFSFDGRLLVPSGSELGDKSVYTGFQELLELYSKVTGADRGLRPFIHNHYVELDGNECGRGVLDVEMRVASQNYELAMIGEYADIYVKQNGVWKFQERSFSYYFDRLTRV